MDIRKQFAVNLVNLMYAKGKRQQDLIEELGYSSATVSQWVNGKMFPRPSKVERLAEYFGVSVNAMYSGVEAPPATVSIVGRRDNTLIEELKEAGVKEVTFKF